MNDMTEPQQFFCHRIEVPTPTAFTEYFNEWANIVRPAEICSVIQITTAHQQAAATIHTGNQPVLVYTFHFHIIYKKNT